MTNDKKFLKKLLTVRPKALTRRRKIRQKREAIAKRFVLHANAILNI